MDCLSIDTLDLRVQETEVVDILKEASLRAHTTLAVNASARLMVNVTANNDLRALHRQEWFAREPVLVLGGGSNLVFASDFPGLVLRMQTTGFEYLRADADFHYLRAEAGLPWHVWVMWTIRAGFTGLENLALIPGTVGAAPVQNIGAYGVELADVFYELEAFDLQRGEFTRFDRDALGFGYRDSVFKHELQDRMVITSVTFRLPRRPNWRIDYAGLRERLAGQLLSAKAIAAAVCEVRNQKLPDPTRLANVGSFFKNPVIESALAHRLKTQFPQMPGFPQTDSRQKIPAAWLIEQTGWKGYRQGDAGVSGGHALVLVNHGQASGRQIVALAQDIITSVAAKFDIVLEIEPRIIDSAAMPN